MISKEGKGCAAQGLDPGGTSEDFGCFGVLTCCSASRSLRSEFITHCLKEAQIYHVPRISSCSTQRVGREAQAALEWIHGVMPVQNAHCVLVSKKRKINNQGNISRSEWWDHAGDLYVCPGTRTTVIDYWLSECGPQLHKVTGILLEVPILSSPSPFRASLSNLQWLLDSWKLEEQYFKPWRHGAIDQVLRIRSILQSIL